MKIEQKIIVLLKNLFLSYILTFFMLIILAFIAYRWELKDKTISIVLIITYIIATSLGGFLTGKKIKEKKFLWGLGLAVIYLILFCVLAIAFHGISGFATANTITTIILCLASGMLGGMLS